MDYPLFGSRGVPLSDDESYERLRESSSRLEFALADLAGTGVRVGRLFRELGETMDEIRRQMEAELTPDERDLYNDLIINGEPFLDAIVIATRRATRLHRSRQRSMASEG